MHISLKYPGVFLVLCMVLSSCITSRRVNYLQKPNETIPIYADTLMFTDYGVQKGDRLYIRVYSTNEQTNSYFNSGMSSSALLRIMNTNSAANSELYTYLVDDEGNITFPMVGSVYVRGSTTREIKTMLEKRLLEVANNTSIEVKIVNRSFSVIGANRTGRYSISKEKLTIFEALAMAGDIDNYGDRSKIRIIRETDEGTKVSTFDIRSEDIINSEFYYIEPNDVIYIQKLNEQVFGLSSFASVISITASTISFGVFLYAVIDEYIVQPIKANKTNQ